MQQTSPAAIYIDARALLERLPARYKAGNTISLYRSHFLRMWHEPVLDPLRQGDARDTYNVRRASLFWGVRALLERLLKKLGRAAETENHDFGRRLVRIISRILSQAGPILQLEPPQTANSGNFSTPSRWQEGDHGKTRGAGSKRNTLKKYPRNWRELIWSAVPAGCQYREAIAVMCLSACRSSEFKAGFRNGRQSEGIVLTLTDIGLDISQTPTKSHNGKYGSPSCGITVNIESSGPAAAYLRDLCLRNGGRYVVSLEKIDGLRKYLERLGRQVLPHCPVVSANTFRTQRLADIKASAGPNAAKAAACAAGHCSDRSQRHYGFAAHGRKGGIVKVHTARQPRMVSTPHIEDLRARRQSRAPAF